jgi:hypothetical protein
MRDGQDMIDPASLSGWSFGRLSALDAVGALARNSPPVSKKQRKKALILTRFSVIPLPQVSDC